MIKKRRAAWYKLFSIVMVLSLLAGMVVPVAPAVAYAEGEDSLPDSPELTTGFADTSLDNPLESTYENDTVQMTVADTVYGEETPMRVGTSSGPTVVVTGNGVENEVTFTLAELEAMEDTASWVDARLYSSINTWPTKKWYVAEGVKLADL